MTGTDSDLPIEPALPALAQALADGRNAVLEAPPGAGKTTRVPVSLLAAPWLQGRKIVMLEPRRLAARAAARRMAFERSEDVGQTVGYRVRFESKVGAATRIEVVTEGIFTRQLQRDPELAGVGLVIFDEFHERSLDADLGLALALECQAALRPDLRILAMSATLDGARVAALMGNAPVVRAEGRAFPVETRYLGESDKRLEDALTLASRRALAETEGDILVFLPGEAEIRRTLSRLEDSGLGSEVRLAPLFGALTPEEQDFALASAPKGQRKIVLATSIAETSLTIEGVRAVIDAGLARAPRFDLRSGMTRLETIKVSQAASEQRKGRAGRVAPGICYRLWDEAAQRGLSPFAAPEIVEADLAPLALDLAQWGENDPLRLAWLDPPPQSALSAARSLLLDLGAIDGDGRITPHGREMARLPCHPRLAHMLIKGRALGLGALAADLAALLDERDFLRTGRDARDCDLRLRLEALRSDIVLPPGISLDRGRLRRVRQAAQQYRRLLEVKSQSDDPRQAGVLTALAYPERIAKRRPGSGDGQFLLANGRGASLPGTDPLSASDFLAIADLDGARRESRIYLAAPLMEAEIVELFAENIIEEDILRWDGREHAVIARKQKRLGALLLEEKPSKHADPEKIAQALMDGVRAEGLSILPWNEDAQNLRARIVFLAQLDGANGHWPDMSDGALKASLEDWLAPFCAGLSRRSHLAGLNLVDILRARLDYAQQQRLDRAAPTHVTVPSGSRKAIDYGQGEIPVLAVRLQEMFGLADTPTVGDGKTPLLLHLLSPASRPIQVTRDLAGFWRHTYKAVKADLMGRYPRHYWPDNPLEAEPTARAKRPKR